MIILLKIVMIQFYRNQLIHNHWIENLDYKDYTQLKHKIGVFINFFLL